MTRFRITIDNKTQTIMISLVQTHETRNKTLQLDYRPLIYSSPHSVLYSWKKIGVHFINVRPLNKEQDGGDWW